MKNAFMIAATGSGCGKTTITCALLKAIKNRGLTPKSFKCGPDYIDPMFHRVVLGIEARNLDLFFSDTEEIQRAFYENNTSDVSVVEGVMGLYDGINSCSNEGSSYDLACRLDIPVILIVNAHGMGRSLLAMIKGFKDMDEDNRIGAVILNQISPMYYETISRQIEEELGLPAIGYFPKVDELHLESRYLGLKMPHEIDDPERNVQKAAEIISETVDIDRLLAISAVWPDKKKSSGNDDAAETLRKDSETERDGDIADNAGAASENTDNAGAASENTDNAGAASENTDNAGAASENTVNATKTADKVRIGVARDEAFCFFYEENLQLLEKMGAELVNFSPLHDAELPKDLDGLLLGGGYPEIYAKQLSDNSTMLDSVRKAMDADIPSLAECGGFMYLHDSIMVDDINYPMVGAIAGSCSKKEKLVRFGYLNIKEKDNHFIAGSDKTIKGHEFHYYDSTNNGNDAVSVKPNGKRSWEAAHITDNHWWGFAHLYYPSNPAFAEAFFNKCAEWRKNNG